ncbi:glycosyl hydrolase family 18 protein [Mucilaginibacter gynuensis]|uniref:chitinase n=2 Tax=Mucilaginibacter gynuensis TaxID=1302236 RepID=A0ABP8FWE9_9SPHI
MCSCKKTAKSEIKTDDGKKPVAAAQFRVVGYLREFNVEDGSAIKFDFGKITHLNIAFINPDVNGDFTTLAGLKELVVAAHTKNVKVLASIGGGNPPAYYTTLLADKTSRTKLESNLAGLTAQYNLDGIDVDLEGSFVDANYEAFVVELKAILQPQKKLLTTAIATAYASQYTDKALAQYDFINIMSYDKTGPWRPQDPGQHSPYQMAVDDLNYWSGTRGIAKDKLSLGVPFYGYGFGSGVPQDMSFSDIIKKYPGSENKDEVKDDAGGTVYYNGIATIKSKTKLALQKAGGIMVWQLLQDDTGTYSLINTIDAEVKAAKK